MSRAAGRSLLGSAGGLLGAMLLGLLLLPLLSLMLSGSTAEVWAAAGHPMFAPALWLSLRTTLASLLLTLLLGTPLSWWLAVSRTRVARIAEVVVELPIVIPPAVIGVGLLHAYGRQGLFGSALETAGIAVPFTTSAVVLAQLMVSSPFYVQAAANAFRKVDPELLIVARTLGASPKVALLRVALPIALPGLVVGASLAWARSLGEFGATLFFAGNMPGVTQTLPLAIFAAMETDVRLAVLFSLVLLAVAALLLLALRSLSNLGGSGERGRS
ncbi:MAG: ABC transporter permease [Myxococcales bacterium]|nr:ABC transporter permease [Myxococcales bacterium]